MKAHTTILIALILALTLHGEDSAEAPHYTAKATIEFKADPGVDAEKELAANLPRGDVSVVVRQVPRTSLFEILVSASDPKGAATRANQIALSLLSLLNDPDGTFKPVHIWMKAEASEAIAR